MWAWLLIVGFSLLNEASSHGDPTTHTHQDEAGSPEGFYHSTPSHSIGQVAPLPGAPGTHTCTCQVPPTYSPYRAPTPMYSRPSPSYTRQMGSFPTRFTQFNPSFSRFPSAQPYRYPSRYHQPSPISSLRFEQTFSPLRRPTYPSQRPFSPFQKPSFRFPYEPTISSTEDSTEEPDLHLTPTMEPHPLSTIPTLHKRQRRHAPVDPHDTDINYHYHYPYYYNYPIYHEPSPPPPMPSLPPLPPMPGPMPWFPMPMPPPMPPPMTGAPAPPPPPPPMPAPPTPMPTPMPSPPPMRFFPRMPVMPPMQPSLPAFLGRNYMSGLNLNPHYQYSRANYYNSLNKAGKKSTAAGTLGF